MNLAAIALLMSGCVKIPEAYFGNYADSSRGASLVLQQNKAVFTAPDGRKFKAGSQELSVADLADAKAGIYDVQDKSSGMIEVYWINPSVGTRQESAGFVWYSAEVLYTYFASAQRDQVQSLQLVQCVNGTVMVDTQTQRVQVGCPENSTVYNLLRTQ